MRLDPKTNIAGVPALRVRDALRRVAAAGPFDVEAMADTLKEPMKTAEGVVAELLAGGYVEVIRGDPDQEGFYELTAKGRQFRLASAAKPLPRDAAARKLAEFLERVHLVNANPDYMSRVAKVFVFG